MRCNRSIAAFSGLLLMLFSAAVGAQERTQTPQKAQKENSASVSPKKQAKAGGATLQETLEKHLETQLELIHAAYGSEDWKTHALQTATLLKFMNQHTSATLSEIDRPLWNRLRKHGYAPYLSITVEHAYRLLRAPTRASTTRFRQFSRVYRQSESAKSRNSTVLIRSLRKKTSYRPYTENAAWAILPLLYSSFGERQIAVGFRPENFVRAAELISSCRRETGTSVNPKAKLGSRKPCIDLLNYVAKQLQSEGVGPNAEGLMGEVANRIGEGLLAGARACLSSIEDAKRSALISKFEDRLSCEQRKRGAPGQWGILDREGNIVRNVAAGSTESDKEEGNGNVEHGNFDKDDGMDSGFYWYLTEKTGDTTNTLYIACDDKGCGAGSSKTESYAGGDLYQPGGTGTTHVDSNGNIKGYEWYGQHDNAGTEYHATMDNGKLKTEKYIDEDGSETHRTYNDDGTVKSETKWDANGNCVSGCTTDTPSPPEDDSTTTPVYEWSASSCGAFGQKELMGPAGNAPSPLDPYIMPAPDAPSGVADDPCLTSFVGTTTSPHTRCKSVAMCLDDRVPDANCRCTGGQGGAAPPPPGGAVCGQIMCAEGSCDPATGTCRSSGSGLPVPGTRGPIPRGGTGPMQLPTRRNLADTLGAVRAVYGIPAAARPPDR